MYEKLDMLMNVVSTYLYGSLDNNLLMKISKKIQKSEVDKNIRKTCATKYQKFLYGLKLSERIWYINHFSKIERYKNDHIYLVCKKV